MTKQWMSHENSAGLISRLLLRADSSGVCWSLARHEQSVGFVNR